jgi:competence protein ComEA
MVRYRFGWIVGIAMIAVFLCSGAAMAETGKIDINKATVEELATLEGIGPQKAQAIVDHRENNGPFRTPVDLTNVPGIGPKTFEANKDRIAVSVPAAAGSGTAAEKPETAQ